MPETFLILLSGGVMLAVAVSSPRQVTVHWLRLAGIIAVSFAGLSMFFMLREPALVVSEFFRKVQQGLLFVFVVGILSHLALTQTLLLRTQRVVAALVFTLAVMIGAGLLHEVIPRGSTIAKPQAIGLQTLACAGVGAMTGLVLMHMLLGHAYLTAAKMTIAPFRRMNLALAAAVVLRILLSICALLIQSRYPIEMFWQRFGLYIGTRWLVGLIVPAILVYMAHDCIRRRSTQSATGILYVSGVLIFIGELIALHLTRETGLPL